MGVCGAGKLVVHTHWKELEQKLADAVTESSESVKYLSTLEKCLEPLYTSESIKLRFFKDLYVRFVDFQEFLCA